MLSAESAEEDEPEQTPAERFRVKAACWFLSLKYRIDADWPFAIGSKARELARQRHEYMARVKEKKLPRQPFLPGTIPLALPKPAGEGEPGPSGSGAAPARAVREAPSRGRAAARGGRGGEAKLTSRKLAVAYWKAVAACLDRKVGR